MPVKVPEDFVRRAATDPQVFGELASRFQGFVRALVRPRVLDAQTAEDICQDVWLIVERELSGLRDYAAFVGWLARITENATTQHLKKRSREATATRDLAVRAPQNEPSAEHLSMMSEQSQAVMKALHSLPQEYRIPVTLRFYQGLTAKEIAEVLDAPLGTILSRLFRANAMLRERLREFIE